MADIEVDMVADMVADKVADNIQNQVYKAWNGLKRCVLGPNCLMQSVPDLRAF